MKIPHLLLLSTLLACSVTSHAQTTPAAPAAAERPVVVSGTVPDEATRQAILGKLRTLYGNDRVVDQLGIGKVSAPPNWSDYVLKLITEDLKQVRNGELDVNGNSLSIRGDVGSQQEVEQLPAQLAARLNPTYQVRSGLRVGTNEQQVLDKALANRIVEFDQGSAILTPRGSQLLDEMLSAIKQLGDRSIQIIGHTDSSGRPEANAMLSQARADSVRQYLVQHGLASTQLISIGKGSLEPVASNNTAEGRARNRRIEFRIAN
ncbi:OmpA family protein [Uliginosibacterium sp. 31-12]|uniref:OmpA family protein n=1 Tax=Uliginosibacterium sp. 31-12 TaxID=3062781 RepID=UPI0026E48DA2|nr:OmpA family protein [Uliginosibacterium sp. 31-12]MDO6384661.1 OmpA family protein [Uliginosibacterium sp. 31-12]